MLNSYFVSFLFLPVKLKFFLIVRESLIQLIRFTKTLVSLRIIPLPDSSDDRLVNTYGASASVSCSCNSCKDSGITAISLKSIVKHWVFQFACIMIIFFDLTVLGKLQYGSCTHGKHCSCADNPQCTIHDSRQIHLFPVFPFLSCKVKYFRICSSVNASISFPSSHA